MAVPKGTVHPSGSWDVSVRDMVRTTIQQEGAIMTPRRELEVLWHVTNLAQEKWGNIWEQFFKNAVPGKRRNGYRPEPPTKKELQQWSYEMWKRCDKILNPK